MFSQKSFRSKIKIVMIIKSNDLPGNLGHHLPRLLNDYPRILYRIRYYNNSL